MRRPVHLGSAALLLALAACRGREVTVFDMPMVAGSSGATGALVAGGGASGSPSSGGYGGVGGIGGAAGAAGTAGTPEAGAAGSVTGGSGGDAGMAGAGGTPSGMPCYTNDDCAGWICEKPGCDAPMGVCLPRPVFPPPDPDPVCGCDGVTYWNDDIRKTFGTTLASIGECGETACACDTGADCDVPYASCSHLLPRGEMCGKGMGACWVLPPQCVETGDPMRWRECRPPDAPDPPPPCVDTCVAIRSERPHATPHHDECK